MFNPKTLRTITSNGKPFQVSPVIFEPLKKAMAAFRAATGKDILINNAYRSTATQAALYKKLKAANPAARVAPPGKSFHERGQAIDVSNWKEAEPFLRAEGFLNPLADDKVHFSIGEFKAMKKTATGAAGLIITGAIIFLLYKISTKGGL